MLFGIVKDTVKSFGSAVKNSIGKVVKIGCIVIGGKYAITGLLTAADSFTESKNCLNKNMNVTQWLDGLVHGNVAEMKTRALNEYAGGVTSGKGVSRGDADKSMDEPKQSDADTKYDDFDKVTSDDDAADLGYGV